MQNIIFFQAELCQIIKIVVLKNKPALSRQLGLKVFKICSIHQVRCSVFVIFSALNHFLEVGSWSHADNTTADCEQPDTCIEYLL